MTDEKTGSFEDFKAYTLAVLRGERVVDPAEPKIWVERVEGEGNMRELRFRSIEAGAKLLSGKNRPS